MSGFVRFLGCWALVWVVGLQALPASAHTELVSSSPAQGERLDEPPATVELRFSEEVVAELAQVDVRSPDGHPVTTARPALSPDGALVTGVRGTGADGTWSVSYRAVSLDGHAVSGDVEFQVGAGGASAVDSPTPVAGAPAADRGAVWWVVVAVAAGLLVLLGVGGVQMMRAEPDLDTPEG